MDIRINRKINYCLPLRFLLLFAFLSLALSLSCLRRQTSVPPAPEGKAESTKISLKEGGEPEEMSEWTLPQIEQEKEPDYKFNKAEKLFDLNFEGADLHTALQSMCDELSYNLIMDKNILDTITVNLKQVTFFKFLEVALDKKKYEYRFEDNFLYVAAPRLETKVFHLNYMTAIRQLTGTMSITGQGGAAGGGLVPQSTTLLQTQNMINLWADIRNGLAQIVLGTSQQLTAALTPEGSFTGRNDATGFSLIIQPISGVVQITATSSVLDEAEGFLKAMESSLQRQVLIEARFIEINLSNSIAEGLDWSLIPDLTSLSNLKGALPGGAALSQTLSPLAREFQIGVSNQNIKTILTAISKNGKVNVLQSPQVTALNNQPAVIRVARNETFFQRQETPGQPATATSAATLPVVNYVPIQQPTGVVLNITPQIGDDGMIIMSIRPSITTIAAVATSPDGLSTSPVTDVRELDTVAKVHHGQTIILAGLIQERDLEDRSETPVLSKLPILGGLFKQVKKERTKVELVILLTPYINYSRTSEEISKTQLPASYKEVAKRYKVEDGQFIK